MTSQLLLASTRRTINDVLNSNSHYVFHRGDVRENLENDTLDISKHLSKWATSHRTHSAINGALSSNKILQVYLSKKLRKLLKNTPGEPKKEQTQKL
ncbi:hypothetical protein NQ317_002530 [Molorchus minor]|uniref:Uncharacterized protein n=1 Tax=Molorchus minor TaxID=1323400 RepID=A0ABQ9IV30_9CUCU|nr:hypothetical protein NQ317_002530 [Molorchus minor]